MSTAVVVDSSVAYKWLSQHDEDSVDDAQALLLSAESGVLVLAAPVTLHIELANALRYSVLSSDDVLTLMNDFEAFHVELFVPNAARLHRSTELAYEHRISVYDALFLALAEELGCPLVTADRRAFEGLTTDVEIRLL